MPYDELQRDIDERAEREYLIHKCRFPASAYILAENSENCLEETVEKLESYPTQMLARLMISFLAELEQGARFGQLLLHGVPQSQVEKEKTKMRELVERLKNTPLTTSADIWSLEGRHGCMTVKDCTKDCIFAMTVDLPSSRKIHMYDSTLLAASQNGPGFVTGVIEQVEVCRQGNFSCPNSSGVLFVGQIDLKHFSTSHQSMINALKGMSELDASQAFDDMSEIDFVQMAVEEGRLPPIRCQRKCPGGQWIEFRHEEINTPHPSSCTALQLKPVLWYRFKDKKEQYNIFEAGDVAEEEILQFSDDVSEDWSFDDAASYDLVDWMSVGNHSGLDELADDGDDGEESDDENTDNDGDLDTLKIRLRRKVSGNVVLLKLIKSENLMDEFDDLHSEPNNDLASLILRGKKIILPNGIEYLP